MKVNMKENGALKLLFSNFSILLKSPQLNSKEGKKRKKRKRTQLVKGDLRNINPTQMWILFRS